MKTCNPQYEHLLPDLLHRAIGAAPLRLTPIPTVPDSIVYEAVLPTGTVIFKTIDPDGRDPDGIGLEAWMCETVRALGVPAPRVYAVDMSCTMFPASYFIMEKASGQPLSTLPVASQTPYLRQVGAYLRRIHSVPIERFGWLDERAYQRDGTVRGMHQTWRAAVTQQIPASLRYFQETGALDPRSIDAIEQILECAGPVLDSITIGHLLHGDIGGLHVWVDPTRGGVISIVDFGERCAGDPVWDIMRYEWEAVPALLEGYELNASMQTRFWPSFYLYAVLQAIPWAHTWHARGGVHTIAWLQTTIREATRVLGL